MSVETQAETPVLEWCLPVIHDCLNEFYREKAPKEPGRADRLTERHFSLWSALARDDFDHLPADREKLAAQARSLCVDARTCRAADLYVAAEILEMIQRRFRRATHEAHANHAALLALLRRLQQQEILAAAPAAETKPARLALAA
ncbi:hypothetical protein [uncultured Rhodoblastus sp.]|uniref:hypothetical protein n=1 Tax=uncultured Rhodoblastus sp. TaxID=543037 RepID=UPI0025CD7882|nr:hypothetical protein [uncultured Rhodoblastus sp.]